jgi:hypothetical protein
MQKISISLAVVFVMLGVVPAHALTCAQQAQACARIAKERGHPEYSSRCLSGPRIAECRKTCIFTGTDGSTWPASGDCKAR